MSKQKVLNTFLEFMFITTYSVVSEIRGEMKYFPGIFSFLSQNWSIVQPAGYRRKSDRAISLSSCNPVPMPFFHYGGKGHGANGAINQSINQLVYSGKFASMLFDNVWFYHRRADIFIKFCLSDISGCQASTASSFHPCLFSRHV